MATLKEDLADALDVYRCRGGEILMGRSQEPEFLNAIMEVLRRHPYDLMQLACVRKTHPHSDSITVTDTQDAASGYVEDHPHDATATAYFDDNPQGKGW